MCNCNLCMSPKGKEEASQSRGVILKEASKIVSKKGQVHNES